MMLTFILAGAMFLGMVLILWSGYRNMEEERLLAEREKTAAPAPAEVQPWSGDTTPDGRCVLCQAPVRRGVTSADVVSEVESRIDAELVAVARFLKEPRAENLVRFN